MRHLSPTIALFAAALFACSSAEDEGEPDRSPPTLEIETPARGTMSPETTVEITGRALDAASGVAAVTINGETAQLDEDGRFALTLETSEGITLLETVAVDEAGNEARDARAVLAGELVDLSEPAAGALVGHIGDQAIGGLGLIVGDVANGIDWTALARSYNPVAASGGDSCNNYKAYIDSVQHGGFSVETGAVTGGIDGGVRVVDLVVRGHIDWRGFCASGTSNYTVTADAFDLDGVIAARLEGQGIAVALESVTTRFTNFQLNVSGVPGFVEDHFEPRVRDKVAQIIRDRARQMVPPLATDFLADFLARTWELELLGRTLGLSVWPVAMDWTMAGGTITLDGAAAVEFGEGGVYLSTPRPAPMDSMLPNAGLSIAVADDLLDQLLAGMWASGAFNGAMVPVEGDTLDAVLGAEVEQATMTLSLPPVASFDEVGAAELVVGDLILEAVDSSGAILARIAISAEVLLSASNGVSISTEAPRILAQVLEQSPALLTPLEEQKVTAIADIAIKQLSAKAGDLFTAIPVPGLTGASLEPTLLQSGGGYMVIGGELSFD